MPSLSQHFNVKDEPCRSLSPLITQTPFPQQKQQHQQQQQLILDISNHRSPILRQLSDPSNIHSSDNKTTELKPISSSLNFSDHLTEPLVTNLSPKTFTSKKIDNQLKPLSSSLNFSDDFPDPLVTNSSPKTFTSTKEIDNKLNDPAINIQQNQWKVNKPQSFTDTYTSFPFNFNTSGQPRKHPNSSHSGSADSSFSLKRHQSSEPLVSPVLQKKFLPEPSVKLSESQTLQSPMSSISSYFQNLGKNSAPDCKPFISLEKHKETSNNDMRTFTNLFTEKNDRETKSFFNLDVKKQITSSDIEITTNPSSSKTSPVDIPSSRKPPPAYSDFQPLTFSDNEPENDKFLDQIESQDTKGSDSNDFSTIKTGSNSSSSDEDGSQEPKKATKVTSTKSRKSRSKDNKPKRQRTSFKVYQLVAMKELFDCDKNPDSIKLTRLADKIDLPKRVLQVWFQNARAKHRKGQNIFSDTIEKMLLPENVGKALEKESQGDENEDCVEDQSLEFDDETKDPTDDVS
ncbi:uncharacterized protein [Clytia hemisphaerica]|uniref:uncharacterized protein n=1 Tax=Clytia hemisphaerica TaxID=252671 RepID=UPI0034D67E3E